MSDVNIRFTRTGTTKITGEATVSVEDGQDWRDLAENKNFKRMLPLNVEFDAEDDEWEFELDDEED